MTAQPVHGPRPGDRVPRTAYGIAGALQGARRMEFYRDLGTAPLDRAEAVLKRWWCEAMLDIDPGQGDVYRAALDGTLPTTTLDEVHARRRSWSASPSSAGASSTITEK